LLVLVIFAGCGSPRIELPEVKPDLNALRTCIKKADRFEIYFPEDRDRMIFSRLNVAGADTLSAIRELFDDPAIVPSEISLSMGFGSPEIGAFSAGRRLFLLKWNYDTKFQILYTDDASIAGSYEVSEAWFRRFVQLCRSIQKQEPNQSSQPTPGSYAPLRG
jgi:hypothetical protein